VVARRSTDTEAIENPHVAAAVRFIREHIDEVFGIDALVRHTSVSRRYLHYHFRRCLGCTPHQYINRARVARAKKLLTEPKRHTLQQIACACGFREPRRLRIVFRRVTGMTPAEYRRSLPKGR
ncbi:MAG: AraC family transcriptional regulator, partial [Planctomycetes bacterium]|nr:AraC family transcriptional regulator [Planctomycetota bacterium]